MSATKGSHGHDHQKAKCHDTPKDHCQDKKKDHCEDPCPKPVEPCKPAKTCHEEKPACPKEPCKPTPPEPCQSQGKQSGCKK